ncbi:IS200/IS605 family transposase [Psychroflexus sp. CAK57W]|uniref:IS200/IS605 family transposase n=1 Tax=Psychroflexus curvus TaxID=2873595 RepID=UPI001CD0390B|nr:IS200/IS605 family transposase [Psychroflexus curvus]MBZ9786777.1 IS200/IS605 family transposase [Psychroflexus curvus]
MANTYTQLYTQFVFSVKGRQNLIRESFRDELEKVMCGIVSNHKCKTYAIYCNPDHTHIFIGMHPDLSPSKLMGQVKSGSSKWVNEKGFVTEHFSWQKGFGAFTYSKSHIDRVVKYILNQPQHHKKQSFREEYLELLEKFDVDYDTRYVFEWYD